VHRALVAHLRYRACLAAALVKLDLGESGEPVSVALDAADAALAELARLDDGAEDSVFAGIEVSNTGFHLGACRSLVGPPSFARSATSDVARAGASSREDRTATRLEAGRTVAGLRRVLELRVLIEGLGFARVPDDDSPRVSVKPEHAFARIWRCVRRVGSKAGSGRLIVPRSLAAMELGGDGSDLRNIAAEDTLAFASTRIGRGARTTVVYDLVADSLVSSGTPACALTTSAGSQFCAMACRAALDALRSGCESYCLSGH
jgi:hypothetical protein